MMNSTDAKKQKQTPASDKPQPLCMIFVIFQSLLILEWQFALRPLSSLMNLRKSLWF